MSQDFGGQSPVINDAKPGIAPIWFGISIQLALIMALSSLVVAATEWLPLSPTGDLKRALAIAMVIAPAALWLLIARGAEGKVARPRRRLLAAAVSSGLVAAAIGVPLAQDFFNIADWLPHESAARRILGFALTVGVVDSGLKLLTLRLLVFPRELRIREDVIAYAFACAVGYSFYVNLELMWRVQPTLGLAAIFALANFSVQFASAMFIALGLLEAAFGDGSPLIMPLYVLAAIASSGLIMPLVTGLMTGPLSTAGSGDRPLTGLLFLCAALTLTYGLIYLLYRVSERRERESYSMSEADYAG